MSIKRQSDNIGKGRRAVVVSCVYPPEPVVSAQTSAQVAEELQSIGFDVTVVTSFPNRPAGKLYPGVSRRFALREKSISGIEIVRCFSTLSPESRTLSRFLENLSFGFTSGWQVLTMPKPSVIYSNTWPIVATGLISIIANIRHIPLVISVQDVYPEAMFAQQRINHNSLISKLMRWIDGLIARNSAHVIVISKNFAEIYRHQRQVPSTRLSVIPNWIDGGQIDTSSDGSAYREKLGIGGTDFLLVYGGNVGVAAGVEVVIEALRLVGGEDALRLVVAGDGSQLAKCQQLAATLPSNLVHFHTPWLATETTEVLRAANLLVLPTRSEQSLASVPSKLLSYMLAGRPVLATALPESDLADLIERSGCGWVVDPDRPDLLAAKIQAICRLGSDELNRRGQAGRTYVLQHLTKEACLPQVVKIIESSADNAR